MPGDDKHERPARNRDEALSKQFGGCTENLTAIRRRKDAALRSEPLEHSGRRDPDYDWEGFDRTPLNVSEMGLDSRELAIEARQCSRTWSPWEIAQRFAGRAA